MWFITFVVFKHDSLCFCTSEIKSVYLILAVKRHFSFYSIALTPHKKHLLQQISILYDIYCERNIKSHACSIKDWFSRKFIGTRKNIIPCYIKKKKKKKL